MHRGAGDADLYLRLAEVKAGLFCPRTFAPQTRASYEAVSLGALVLPASAEQSFKREAY